MTRTSWFHELTKGGQNSHPREVTPHLWKQDQFRADGALLDCFEQINRGHFDGFLEAPVLRWNSRLRSSAGRFIPGSRKHPDRYPPIIEIASYLLVESECAKYILDTLAHEMIHFWLWTMHRPYGHTTEFHNKMRIMGVSRYNPVPRVRPPKYIYRCPACNQEFPARRTLGALACAKCCKRHTNGRYDPRFKLVLDRHLPTQVQAGPVVAMGAASPRRRKSR